MLSWFIAFTYRKKVARPIQSKAASLSEMSMAGMVRYNSYLLVEAILTVLCIGTSDCDCNVYIEQLV